MLKRRLPNEGRLASEAEMEGALEGSAEAPGVRPGAAWLCSKVSIGGSKIFKTNEKLTSHSLSFVFLKY